MGPDNVDPEDQSLRVVRLCQVNYLSFSAFVR